MRKLIVSSAFAAAATLATPAFAVTVADGETFCESQNNIAGSTAACTLGGNADFPTTIAGAPTLTFEGSGTILGFLADDTGPSANYGDVATIVLDKAATLTFSLLNSDSGIDVVFSFGASTFDVLANGTASLFATAGTYIFGVDATNPSNSLTRLETDFSLEIAAVPLPAGGLMLLAGLGGMGIARRRKKA